MTSGITTRIVGAEVPLYRIQLGGEAAYAAAKHSANIGVIVLVCIAGVLGTTLAVYIRLRAYKRRDR